MNFGLQTANEMGALAVFDLLLRNCRLVDGTGNAWLWADVATKGKKIAAIWPLPATPGKGGAPTTAPTTDSGLPPARRTIDAAGRYLAPGFIDIHTHSDLPILVDPHNESKVRQGVTTEVTNNCGGWAAPLHGYARKVAEQDAARYGADPSFLDWTTMPEYLDRLERSPHTINAVTLVGHGTIRTAVMGHDNREPTAAELEKMKAYAAEAMEAGCAGMSTGIYYTPGAYAKTGEFIAMAEVVARYGGMHASHIRDESDYNIGLLPAIDEVIEIARATGIRTQIAHVKCLGPATWGQAEQVLARIDAARAAGLDVTGDRYPYDASGSSIGSSLLPRWAQEGGKAEMVKRLQDPSLKDKLTKEMTANLARRGGPERLVLSQYRPNPAYDGLSLAEVAAKMGKDPVTTAQILLQDGDSPLVSHVMDEKDTDKIIRHPALMAGSDGSCLAAEGPLAAGQPHPRHFGTFPRYLAYYVRARKVVGLEDMVRRMSGFPAQKLQLKDRGLVKEGYWADLVLFDAKKVKDTATFLQPKQYPEGIDLVVVNGEIVVENGRHTGKFPGATIRF